MSAESIRTPDNAVEESLRSWMGQVLTGKVPNEPPPVDDPAVLQDFLQYHGIAPCVHQQLIRLPDRSDLDSLRCDSNALKRRVAREMLHTHEFQRTFPAVCDGLRTPPIIFKGQALAHTVYAETWHRPRADIDILVDEVDLPRLFEAMTGAGYEHATVIDGDLISRQTILHKTTHEVEHTWDVHWGLSNRPGLADALTHREVLEDARLVETSQIRFLVPGHIDSLLIACLHLIGHHSQEPRLIWLYDMFLLAGSMSDEDRQRFLRKAGRNSALETACAEGLTMSQRYLPNEIQASLMEQLGVAGVSGAGAPRYYAARLVEDARVLGFGDKLRFIRQHVLPSTRYMKKRFGITRCWHLPFWYAYRIARAVPKLFKRR